MASKKNVVSLKDEDISAQLDALRADVAVLAQTIKAQAKETVSNKAGELKGTASEKLEEGKDKYDEMTAKAEKSIKENPLTAVAIAVGAGLLLGALTRR